MQGQQQQPGGIGLSDGARFVTTMFYLLIGAMVAPAETILRHEHGSRHFQHRIAGLLAGYVLLLTWPATTFPYADPGPMLILAQLYPIMLIIRSVQAGKRRSNPIPGIHSLYTGTPYILPRLFGNRAAKAIAEPVMYMLGGAFLLPANEPLGSYCLAAGFCLMAVNAMHSDAVRRRHEAIEDARIEAYQARRGY